jgi:hypothetical protein
MKNLRLWALAAVAASVLSTTGCSSTVSLEPADFANTPACADVTVRLPQTVGELEKRTTDAQATGAYGDPAAVIVRCGLPGVTVSKLRCVSTSGVDWLVDESKAPTYRFVTFGRQPATEVIVNSKKAVGVSTLDALAPAIKAIPATTNCLG